MELQLQTESPLASSAKTKLEAVEIHKQDIKKSKQFDKLQRKQTSLQSKIDLLHDHEYDPDCEFCCNNEFVKQAEQAKVDILSVDEELENTIDKLTKNES